MVGAAPDVQAQVEEFVTKLKRREVEGAVDTARYAATLLRQVISQHRIPASAQASTLIEAVKSVGLRMMAANPIELAVGNVLRRVLHIIREEDASLAASALPGGVLSAGSDDEDAETGDVRGYPASVLAAANRTALRAPSLHNLLESVPGTIRSQVVTTPGSDSDVKSRSGDRNSRSWKLKHNVIEGINELLNDIDNFRSQIADQALEHIHQNEVILTWGRSRTLLQFLLEARKKRSFQVVIAEGAPRYKGHAFAKELAAVDLQTTLITDSAVFAMMARVNMVIVGAHAVMANGGVLGPVGSNLVALAAKQHAIPFVVLAGVHKLSPLYPHNPYTLLNDLKSPADVLDFGEFSDCLDGATGASQIHAVNPAFDYVPPELVTLFLTDTGGHNPSYVYRLIAEYYSPEDFVLQ